MISDRIVLFFEGLLWGFVRGIAKVCYIDLILFMLHFYPLIFVLMIYNFDHINN
jgi:hypothetical protein